MRLPCCSCQRSANVLVWLRVAVADLIMRRLSIEELQGRLRIPPIMHTTVTVVKLMLLLRAECCLVLYLRTLYNYGLIYGAAVRFIVAQLVSPQFIFVLFYINGDNLTSVNKQLLIRTRLTQCMYILMPNTINSSVYATVCCMTIIMTLLSINISLTRDGSQILLEGWRMAESRGL